MTPRSSGRTQPCSENEARTRLSHAHKFLDVAELVAGEDVEYTIPRIAEKRCLK
jgi:hypothetical protein